MAILPTDIPTGLVTGQFYFVNEDNVDGDTNPELIVVQGTVTFTCSAPLLRMPTKLATVIPLTFDAVFDSNGNLVSAADPTVGLKLPATDSVLFNPTGFTWRVTFSLTQAFNGYTVQVAPFDIQVPAGGTVDLTTAMPVSTSPGVLTIQGPPGSGTDAFIAAQVNNTGSATRGALNASYSIANPTLTITYNTDGTVASTVEDGITSTFTYNTDGSVHTQTRAGVTKTFTYDASGNLTGAS